MTVHIEIKRPLKKKAKNWFSRPIIALCRSNESQDAPREHSAILSTVIKLPFGLVGLNIFYLINHFYIGTISKK